MVFPLSIILMAVPAAREFFDLVKAIGESKSKQEEDRIIADEVCSHFHVFSCCNFCHHRSPT